MAFFKGEAVCELVCDGSSLGKGKKVEIEGATLGDKNASLEKLDGHGMLRESYCQNPSTTDTRRYTKGGNKDRDGQLSVEEKEDEPRGL